MTAMMAKNTSKLVVSSSDESDSGSPIRKYHRHDRFKTERRVHFLDQKTVMARESEFKEDDPKARGEDHKVKRNDHKVKEEDHKSKGNDYKIKEIDCKDNENIITVKKDDHYIKERIKGHKHKKHKKHKHKSIDLDFSNGNTGPLKTSMENSIGAIHHKSNDNAAASSSSPYNVEASCSNYYEIEAKLCDSNKVNDQKGIYGPSLPPGFMNTTDNTFGPALPPKLKPSNEGTNLPNREKIFGPSLPPKLLPYTEEPQFSDFEDFVGPVPEGFMDIRESTSLIQNQLTSRADYLRTQLAKETEKGEDDKTKRETWMLELPPEKSSIIGLGPRTFRRREGPDMGDRSVWTDTPEMKIKRETDGKKGEEKKVRLKSEAVLATEKAVEEYLASSSSKYRTKSLLEMHQEKRKKKQKKEKKEKSAAKPERRPFDRDIDLQVNRFDDAQRKAIYKKAQLLDSRFSSGESKFL